MGYDFNLNSQGASHIDKPVSLPGIGNEVKRLAASDSLTDLDVRGDRYYIDVEAGCHKIVWREITGTSTAYISVYAPRPPSHWIESH